MLHLLPIPNQDELLYSIIARFAWRLGLEEARQMNRLLYGKRIRETFIVPDLPTRLDEVQAAVPPEHPLSKCDIVHLHTLFPIYSPFMPIDRACALASFMRSVHNGPKKIPVPLSMNRNPDGGLRVCPRCLAEDDVRTGELWWRRAHNVPGVIVCSKHRVFLVGTGIGLPSAQKACRYVMPPEVSDGGEEVSKDNREQEDMVLLARHAEWLLCQPKWQVEPTLWVSAYRSKLARLGYCEGRRENNLRLAIEDFQKRFSPSFLCRIGLSVRVAQHTRDWLWRMVTYAHQMHPPLRHMLFWIWLDIAPGDVKRELIDEDQVQSSRVPTESTKLPLQTETGRQRLKTPGI